jgi:hypothetical protein
MVWCEMCSSRAADCEEKAKHVRDPRVQELYGALAEEWRQLAKVPEPRIPARASARVRSSASRSSLACSFRNEKTSPGDHP